MTIRKHLARLRLIRPLLKIWWQGRGDEDSWRSIDHHVPISSIARGAHHEIGWYLKGPSAVTVQSLDEICEWLVGCEYVSDLELFREADFWQHPATFELLRKGDCEDYALWAWRKLLDLGIEAEFMMGRTVHTRTDGYHTWVVFSEGRRRYVLEPVASDAERMIIPFAIARADYFPYFSIDGKLVRRIYRGAFAWLEERRTERRVLKRMRPGSRTIAP